MAERMGGIGKTPLKSRLRRAVGVWPYIGILLLGGPMRCAGQAPSIWELTPPHVAITVGVDPATGLTAHEQTEFAVAIAEKIEQFVGAAWQIDLVEQPFARVRSLVAPAAPLASVPELLDASLGSKPADKWLFLLVMPRSGGLEFFAREYDLRVEQWGHVHRKTLENPATWAVVGFRTLLAAYRPLGHVEATDDRRRAVVRLQGSALPFRDASLARVQQGDVFELFVRFNRRDGTARAIRRIDWTALEVAEPSAPRIDPSGIVCQVHSALRSPLARRRGRVERLALLVKTPPGTTRLRVVSSDAPSEPLPGYTVYDASGPESVKIGITDERGEVLIGPAQRRLRLLWITSGGDPLAPRLPIIPGRLPELIVRLPNDGPRLEAAGFIAGIQEEMVDLVVRRRVMLALANRYLARGKIDEAERLLEQLKRLPNRSQFAVRLTAFEQRLQLTDQRSQRKVDQMLRDTRDLLQSHLDPQPIRRLEARIRQARREESTARDVSHPVDSVGIGKDT